MDTLQDGFLQELLVSWSLYILSFFQFYSNLIFKHYQHILLDIQYILILLNIKQSQFAQTVYGIELLSQNSLPI